MHIVDNSISCHLWSVACSFTYLRNHIQTFYYFFVNKLFITNKLLVGLDLNKLLAHSLELATVFLNSSTHNMYRFFISMKYDSYCAEFCAELEAKL